jgi:hypothetical protein
MIEQASIASKISKALLTVRARQRCLAERVKSVQGLDEELRNWYKHLPQVFKPKFPVEIGTVPSGLRLQHVLCLHFSYHGNLAALHSIFGHPWNVLLDGQKDFVRDQVAASNKALTNSSRQLLLASRSIPVDAAAPLWYGNHPSCINMLN